MFVVVTDCVSQSQELVFVMILSPYFLNSVFFWVMDNLLMASSAKSGDDVLQTNRHMAIPTGSESYSFIWRMHISVIH